MNKLNDHLNTKWEINGDFDLAIRQIYDDEHDFILIDNKYVRQFALDILKEFNFLEENEATVVDLHEYLATFDNEKEIE